MVYYRITYSFMRANIIILRLRHKMRITELNSKYKIPFNAAFSLLNEKLLNLSLFCDDHNNKWVQGKWWDYMISFLAISDGIKSNNTKKFEEFWNEMQFHWYGKLCDECFTTSLWLDCIVLMQMNICCSKVNLVDVNLKWTPSAERKRKPLPLNTGMVYIHNIDDDAAAGGG